MNSYSQYNISGVIVDNTTMIPIENCKIIDILSKAEVYTDSNGSFSFMSNNKIIVSSPGYETKEVIINRDEHLTIYLIPTINKLEEILVKAASIPIEQKHATDAVSIINKKEIDRGNTIELHPILNKVAGVFMQHATLNTNRIAIRGIGARNLFGTANIRTYFGDIPLTDGNGESSIEDIELASLSKIEIHKGPSSSTYGVGLGGTILLKPTLTNYQESRASLSTSVGSYGLRRTVANVTKGGKKSNFNILYSNNHSDGYRVNNTYDRNTVTITAGVDTDNMNTFSIIASYINLKAGIPSSLNQEDFDTNPRQAAFTWGRSQAFEDIDYGILGITWNHQYSDKYTQYTSLFGSFRNNYEPRPFNILSERSNTLGIRSRILGKHTIHTKELTWNLGGELFFDFYNGRTFDNLYQDFPPGTGSVQGNQLSDLQEKRNYYNLFAETNLKLNNKLRFNLGLHLNQTFFDVNDQFLQDGINSSGTFDFNPIFSPKIGINYVINSNLILFGNIAHGFSTPTTTETLLPEGVFNPDIKPEIGWNYETGVRYKFLKNKIYGSISLYTLRVRDLLVTRRTVEDNFFAINAGKTNHNGIEGEINYTSTKTNYGQLNFYINTSLNMYTFDEFTDLEADFSGNNLTGVPKNIMNLGIDLISEKKFYANLNFQAVGEIPVNDANTVFNDPYELLNGKIGYQNTIKKHWKCNVYIGANNILDKKHASQLQINAIGFGGNAPRYFYPGLPFNIYGGININYRL